MKPHAFTRRATGQRTVHAVNDISLTLGAGEVLGLLGESGTGKSVPLRALMRLVPKKRTQISGTLKVLGRDVLAQSSNIGTAQIALRSGGVRQREFLTHLGLLRPVQSELPETARPLYPGNWGTIETATVGFGHGISVSPLSFATAVASVVNGGRRIAPTFIKQAAGDLRGEQVIKPETSLAMRDLLRHP